jgi:phosphopantothenoylcysteine decarboxylase/phosphopantothenate--cysteine ligase
MRCIVTAGPTYEPLDNVRRLTNFSTGRLGSELAGFLTAQGHEVTLLLGEMATYREDSQARRQEMFTTTANLRERLQVLAAEAVGAVFHAAAVSDFTFGKILTRTAQGELIPAAQNSGASAGKISTRQGPLLAELLPTPKILAELRSLFPTAQLVGWKYEVDGDQDTAVRLAREQITECKTDACVANGPAYGLGFGLVKRDVSCTHFGERDALYKALDELITSRM